AGAEAARPGEPTAEHLVALHLRAERRAEAREVDAHAHSASRELHRGRGDLAEREPAEALDQHGDAGGLAGHTGGEAASLARGAERPLAHGRAVLEEVGPCGERRALAEVDE